MGVFDGLHCGHRKILRETVKKAKDIRGASIALTFWPHPQKQDSIYSLQHRLRLISELDLDVCVVINFNPAFSQISAGDFIKNILVKKIGAHYVYIGENFRFGRGALGNLALLQSLGKVYGFGVRAYKVLKLKNKPISSTYIRFLITKGRLKTAEKLLMHRVSILGTVIKGISLGRYLGFPTANIKAHHEVLPPKGVYAVRIIFKKRKLKGLCYIGTKPTILEIRDKAQGPKPKLCIEVYILNFKQNIYGQYLEIQFLKKIRPEKKFPSFKALTCQIKKDVAKIFLN
jgi:riboflavin kinase/FMN adenylyltransferase